MKKIFFRRSPNSPAASLGRLKQGRSKDEAHDPNMRLMTRHLKKIFFIPRVNGGPKVTVKVKDSEKNKITDKNKVTDTDTDTDKIKNQINLPI